MLNGMHFNQRQGYSALNIQNHTQAPRCTCLVFSKHSAASGPGLHPSPLPPAPHLAASKHLRLKTDLSWGCERPAGIPSWPPCLCLILRVQSVFSAPGVKTALGSFFPGYKPDTPPLRHTASHGSTARCATGTGTAAVDLSFPQAPHTTSLSD